MFDDRRSESLSEAQKARLRSRFGPRVTAVAQDARSQARNRELAVERLQERIAAALKPRKRRRPTRATRRLAGAPARTPSAAARRPSATAAARRATTEPRPQAAAVASASGPVAVCVRGAAPWPRTDR